MSRAGGIPGVHAGEDVKRSFGHSQQPISFSSSFCAAPTAQGTPESQGGHVRSLMVNIDTLGYPSTPAPAALHRLKEYVANQIVVYVQLAVTPTEAAQHTWEQAAGAQLRWLVDHEVPCHGVTVYQPWFCAKVITEDMVTDGWDSLTLDPDVLFPGNAFWSLLEHVGNLHDVKAADYGTPADPLANIRAAAEFGVPPWLGAVIRANDKIARIKAYTRNGRLTLGKLDNDLLDAAVYLLIARLLYEETANAGE